MRSYSASFLLLLLTATLSSSFKFSFFNSKTIRMIKLADQGVVSGISPETGRAVDYVTNSKKAAASFVEFDAGNCHSYVNITLVSKSNFKSWSSSISNSTHEFLDSIGQSMKSFPGGKTISLPVSENLSVVSMLSFYDDSDVSSKFSHKAFDGIWSGLKNKTYHFKGIDEAGKYVFHYDTQILLMKTSYCFVLFWFEIFCCTCIIFVFNRLFDDLFPCRCHSEITLLKVLSLLSTSLPKHFL